MLFSINIEVEPITIMQLRLITGVLIDIVFHCGFNRVEVQLQTIQKKENEISGRKYPNLIRFSDGQISEITDL